MTDNKEDALDVVKSCFLMENDDDALLCLEKLIQSWPQDGECRPSLVLLTQENCPPCEEEKKAKARGIAAGAIEVIDINSIRGAEIARINGIEGVPYVLLLDCKDHVIEEGAESGNDTLMDAN